MLGLKLNHVSKRGQIIFCVISLFISYEKDPNRFAQRKRNWTRHLPLWSPKGQVIERDRELFVHTANCISVKWVWSRVDPGCIYMQPLGKDAKIDGLHVAI